MVISGLPAQEEGFGAGGQIRLSLTCISLCGLHPEMLTILQPHGPLSRWTEPQETPSGAASDLLDSSFCCNS